MHRFKEPHVTHELQFDTPGLQGPYFMQGAIFTALYCMQFSYVWSSTNSYCFSPNKSSSNVT